MKFYLDKNYEVLTEEQFKERFFTKEIIFSMLLDGVLQDEFIKICSICSGSNTIKDAVDHFIQEIQWDTKLLLKYCEKYCVNDIPLFGGIYSMYEIEVKE